jgi:bifunctional DNA-binding transcriptional regulator/antitoxin component of YhaV-PrlF toxin-antitoxin module
MNSPVQVRQRGTLTLPAELRDKYGIKQGDTYYLLDLEGIFVLTPMVPLVPELAREIERLRVEAGVSTAQLLEDLREQRERYHQEQQDRPVAQRRLATLAELAEIRKRIEERCGTLPGDLLAQVRAEQDDQLTTAT